MTTYTTGIDPFTRAVRAARDECVRDGRSSGFTYAGAHGAPRALLFEPDSLDPRGYRVTWITGFDAEPTTATGTPGERPSDIRGPAE